MEIKTIFEDEKRKLFFEDDTLKLLFEGAEYTFACQPYEPMAVILRDGKAVTYIHNAFDVEFECREFVRDPKHLVNTITDYYHNAEHFCMMLTVALRRGEWQIDDLEEEMFMLVRFETREVYYKTDDIEFGLYGEEPMDDIDPAELDDEPKTHFEYDIMYIMVDGVEYHLEDANMNKVGQMGIFEKGKRKPKIRIHGTNGSVIAAYGDHWRSGDMFTPFGFPCNTEMFCKMVAYAIRDGQTDYTMTKLVALINGDVKNASFG